MLHLDMYHLVLNYCSRPEPKPQCISQAEKERDDGGVDSNLREPVSERIHQPTEAFRMYLNSKN